MKKCFSTLLTIVLTFSTILFYTVASVAADTEPAPVSATPGQEMFRMYNPNSGEHFYTAASSERNHLIQVGWNYEGIGWIAPKSGSPVYRLYNRNTGDHHYTVSAGERNALQRIGWHYEGIGWRSGGSVPIYRQYNPHAKTGTHNYTTSKGENNALVRVGWRSEGIGWYALLSASGKSTAGNVKDGVYYVNASYTNEFSPQHIVSSRITNKSLVIEGVLEYKPAESGFWGDENTRYTANGTYNFPYTDTTVFTRSGGDAPSEVISAEKFMEIIHLYNGLGVTLNVRGGTLVSADISS